jgi:nucleolar MIF4G domain-containing protein 1
VSPFLILITARSVIEECLSNQEKSYNPYYTLIAQHLCRTSHSYKVTLQFCLWDFLRDLGETTVGGAEVLKNTKDDVGFDVRKMSATKMTNIAKAYGWWIAKDCCTLTILRVSFLILESFVLILSS